MPETIKRMFRPGGVLNLTIAALASLAIGWGAFVSLPRVWSGSMDPGPLTNGELAVALTRVGLDAAPLAASGATSQQVQSTVTAVRNYLTDNIQTLRDRDQAWADARKQVDDLAALIQSGTATSQQINSLATAQAQLDTAASQRQATLDAVFNAGAAALLSAQATTINAIKAARAERWDLPTQYLVVSRSQANWLKLREALANKRVNAKHGLQASTGAQQTLLTEDANVSVAAAKTSLDAGLSAAATTWNQSVYP